MQTLSSIWLPRSDSCVVTQLHSELASSSCSILSGNRKRLNFCDPGCRSRNPSRRKSFRYSIVKFCVFAEPKRGSLAGLVPLALGLQEQAVEGEVVKEDSSSFNESPDKDDMEDLNGSHLHLRYNKNEEGEEERESGDERRDQKGIWVNTRALAWSLRFAKTADDIEEILKDKDGATLQAISAVIRGLGKDKNVASAIALVEWLKEKKNENDAINGPNLSTYNSLLGAMKRAKTFKHVEKFINVMSTEGINPDIVTYNILMGIYTEQRRELDTLKLFEEIKEKGLSPCPASYSTALLAYRRLEDGFGALKFYLDFKEKYQNGEIVDENVDWETEASKLEDFIIRICFQVMRRWLVRRADLSSKVLKLLTEMDKAGLQTGRAEQERLVWACTRIEHYVVAKELYSRIRERDSEISASVCNHVIWILGKAKKWWAALEIYEDMLDRGPKPNNLSYELIVSNFNILLSVARKKGFWNWGVMLLNKMEEKGFKPGSKEWNSVLIACSKAWQTAAAVEIFKRMVERGEKPTIISYGALLSALEKGKLYEEAIQVWKSMIRIGVEPNLYAYTIMASIRAGQGKFDEVDLLIQEMRSSKLEPTVIMFNAIISVCARNSMGGPAYEWLQRMKAENLEANEVSYEMSIKALANDGKPRLAYELYLRARTEGLNLSCKAYDAVIRSSQEHGASIDESSLGPRPPEKPKKVVIAKNLSNSSDLADVPRRRKPYVRNKVIPRQKQVD